MLLTKYSKKILKELRKNKIVVFERDDSPEAFNTLIQLQEISNNIGICILTSERQQGNIYPYKVYIIDEDFAPRVGID